MKTHWKIIIAVLGIMAPSVFTYLSARAGSDEAKVRAEVAYLTMQGVVKELQDASYKQALQLAKVEGRLDARPSTIKETDGDGIPSLVRPAPQVKLKPPPSFSDALQRYKEGVKK